MRLLRPALFFFVFVFVIGTASAVLAEKRVALVIGNGAYPSIGRLGNPPNDAKLMARTLRQLGFSVIERINVNQKNMKKAIKAFGDQLANAGKDAVGLFYYAGHGVQVGGTNYLIPVNVDIQDEGDVDIEAVSANTVQNGMAFAGNRLNIIIMDACRNNPFKRSFRSATRGLSRMDATKGTLIAYATSPGDVAADGKGKNSPYTQALSQALLTPGLTVERAFKKVRNSVVTVTKGKQVPWEASSLTGADFYFLPGSSKTAVVTPKPQLKPAPQQADIVAWQSIQNSSNLRDFETFMRAFPNSPFVGFARNRLSTLKKPQTASLPPPSSTGSMIRGLDFSVSTITPQMRRKYPNAEKENGLVITSVIPKGVSQDKGISEGDVIVEISQEAVTTIGHARSLVKKSIDAGRKRILLLLSKEGVLRFVAVRLNRK